MKAKWLISVVFALVLGLGSISARADDDDARRSFPTNATFTTLITTPRAVEGLTGDNHGNLYIGGSVPPPPLSRLENQSQQTHTDYSRKHCARFSSSHLRLRRYRFE